MWFAALISTSSVFPSAHSDADDVAEVYRTKADNICVRLVESRCQIAAS